MISARILRIDHLRIFNAPFLEPGAGPILGNISITSIKKGSSRFDFPTSYILRGPISARASATHIFGDTYLKRP